MPANWVIFIPRSRAQASEVDAAGPSLVSQAEKWKTHVTSKLGGDGATKKYSFHLICNGEQLSVALGNDDVVYIYGGHGLTNQDFVSWPGNTNNPISSDAMAGLVRGVVPPGFLGRLKVYSCYSGESGESAFASRLTKKLRAMGYDCFIYGYKGQVTQGYDQLKGIVRNQLKGKFPEAPEGAFDGSHRWSVMGSVGKAMHQGRAKGDRLEF